MLRRHRSKLASQPRKWKFIDQTDFQSEKKKLGQEAQKVRRVGFFVGLDGFDQHYQASVHFPLTSAVVKSQQQQNKFSEALRIEPWATGVSS